MVERNAELFGVEVIAPSSIDVRKRRLVNELRAIEQSVDFTMLRRRRKRKYATYEVPITRSESWQRLRYQRRQTIESIMRVAASCRTMLRDENASQRVRVELLVSLGDPLSGRPRVSSGQIERRLFKKWVSPRQPGADKTNQEANQKTALELNAITRPNRQPRSNKRRDRGLDR